MPIGYFCFMKIFWKYAPTVQEDIHALVHCNFNETKPQVFYKLDAIFNNTSKNTSVRLLLKSATTTANYKGIFQL